MSVRELDFLVSYICDPISTTSCSELKVRGQRETYIAVSGYC